MAPLTLHLNVKKTVGRDTHIDNAGMRGKSHLLLVTWRRWRLDQLHILDNDSLRASNLVEHLVTIGLKLLEGRRRDAEEDGERQAYQREARHEDERDQ